MSKASHSKGRASRVGRPHLFTGEQVDLFQQLEQPAAPTPNADLDIGPELLGAIHTAIREAKARGLSRERIVDRMNALLPDLPRPITVRQLNAWTAASQEYKEFPARFVPAFCAATECDMPMRALALAIGRDLVDARESAALRLGQTYIESARLKREQCDLKRTLGACP